MIITKRASTEKIIKNLTVVNNKKNDYSYDTFHSLWWNKPILNFYYYTFSNNDMP